MQQTGVSFFSYQNLPFFNLFIEAISQNVSIGIPEIIFRLAVVFLGVSGEGEGLVVQLEN